ncbi:hypothetical protein D9615_003215 [Tricholomella constricta]|uniref:Uncharacterized protein n=1 Tax=Tricholomella constricta TaxID=117010 RepID=A0A8H5HJN6_9AGAR|nr:hypothetical protein D9615_003215 [Tricholomella constricta]
MRERYATTELDKIAGIAYLVRPGRIQIYNEKQSVEDAWAALIAVMGIVHRAHLFYWYPVAGTDRYAWAPSWAQMMEELVPPAEVGIMDMGRFEFDAATKSCKGYCNVFNDAFVLRLDSSVSDPVARGTSSCDDKVERRGKVVVTDKAGQAHEFGVIANHRKTISEAARYVLVLSNWFGFLAVGTKDGAGRFRKICVICVTGGETQHGAMEAICGREDVIFA